MSGQYFQIRAAFSRVIRFLPCLVFSFGVFLLVNAQAQTVQNGKDIHPSFRDSTAGSDYSDSLPIVIKSEKKTKCDIDAPYWYNLVPYEGAILVSPHFPTFQFELRDEQSGIDLSTFRLRIDGMAISATDQQISITGYDNHYKVIYQYPEDHVFVWGQRVDIYLSVCDDSSNCLNDSSFFMIDGEENAPVIEALSPQDGDADIARNTPFQLKITDDRAGLNFETLSITIDGKRVSSEKITGNFGTLLAELLVAHENFLNNHDIQVTVAIKDFAGNQGYLEYSFFTVHENDVPIIDFIHPSQTTTTDFSPRDSLVFRVTDALSGIGEDATEMRLSSADKNIPYLLLSRTPADPNGYEYTIIPQMPLRYNESAKLWVGSVDYSGNSAQDSILFNLQQDAAGPLISLLEPDNGDVEVPFDHQIILDFTDHLSGLDTTQIHLQVNGIPVFAAGHFTAGFSGDFREIDNGFQVSVPYAASWNDTITIDAVAADLAFPANPVAASFQYFIRSDFEKPKAALIHPISMINVNPVDSVRIDLEDNSSGINFSGIEIFVNGEAVNNYQVDGDSAACSVSFLPPVLFDENVQIHLLAADIVGNQLDTLFTFLTIPDLGGVRVTAVDPHPDDVVVARNTAIEFTLESSGYSLDYESLDVLIGDSIIPSVDLIFGEQSDFFASCRYQPGTRFQIGEWVNVKIQARDTNFRPAFGDTNYVFKIVDDAVAPEIVIIEPDSNAVEISRRPAIVLDVLDAISGIDPASVIMQVNFVDIAPLVYPFAPDTWLGPDAHYRIEFLPEEDFAYNDTVWVSLEVADNRNNQEQVNYHFFIVRDDSAPEFSNIRPAPDAAVHVPVSQIGFDVTDSRSGVDFRTLIVSVNDTLVNQQDVLAEVIPDGYRISVPGSVYYQPGMVIPVFAQVADSVGNRAFLNYTFSLIADSTAPMITWLEPSTSVDVPINTMLLFQICDAESKINTGTVELFIENEPVIFDIETISEYCVNVSFNQNQARIFPLNTNIDFFVSAKNFQGLTAILDSTFTTVDDLTPPEITIEPIITPVQPTISILASVDDFESGIVLDSTRITVQVDDGEPYQYDNLQTVPDSLLRISAITETGYRLWFNPDQRKFFNYFQRIQFWLYTENSSDLSAEKYVSFTIMDTDTTRPVISNLEPVDNTADLPLAPVFSFDVSDNEMLDLASIQMQLSSQKLGELPVILERRPDTEEQFCHVIAVLNQTMMWNDTLYAQITAADTAGNTARPITAVYYLTRDDVGPEIIPVTPLPAQRHVSGTTNFQFMLWDSLSGVAAESVELFWNLTGWPLNSVSNQNFEFTRIADSLRLDVDLSGIEFPKQAWVEVHCAAEDSLGNRSEFSMNFQIETYDRDIPLIEIIKPEPGKYVSLATLNELVFDVWDTSSFVQSEKILVDFYTDTTGRNGANTWQEWHYDSGDLADASISVKQIDATTRRLRVTCRPKDQDYFTFSYNDLLKMCVTAQDSCDNFVNCMIGYEAVIDTTPPAIIYAWPEDEDTQLSISTGIDLSLKDETAGIDTQYVHIEMKVLQHFEEIPTLEEWADATVVYPQQDGFVQLDPMTHLTDELHLSYPAGDNFDYNQIICLRVKARDAVPFQSNQLDQIISFRTETMLSDLSWAQMSVLSIRHEVGDSLRMKAAVQNTYFTVYQDVPVVFSIENNEDLFYSVVSGPLEANGTPKFVNQSVLPLTVNGTLEVIATIDPDNIIDEVDETNNVTTFQISVSGGELEVKSDPFTPNNDGINDEACFNCDDFKLNSPLVKIFDLRGKVVKVLREYSAGQKFYWNGSDESGARLTTGAYLYVLIDGNRVVSNGCVTLIR